MFNEDRFNYHNYFDRGACRHIVPEYLNATYDILLFDIHGYELGGVVKI